MHFCSQCENMYYIYLNGDNTNKLVYYCRKCGHSDSNIGVDSMVVSSIQVKKSSQQFNHIINKYTKYDPTLPRKNNILCPNAECSTNTENEPREIIYIRYDENNMKYVYLCATCDTTWTTQDKQ
jgi:DNA-directed RNA polymerase subunit M/transcription elongation factor TFIIS